MNVVLLVCAILLADDLNPGFEAEAISYDYTASIECLAQPHKPQYNGGIIKNPELNDGLEGWTTFGDAKIEHRESLRNKFVVAHGRNQPFDSVSQKIYLQEGMLYTLSAWIQVSEGNVPVTAAIKTTKGVKFGGAIFAEPKCWSMLKGGLVADTSGPADLYFESNDTAVEIWIDSISLQPFTKEQWKSHQLRSIDKVRKRNVKVKAVDEQGNPLPNATISFNLRRANFPFGSSINRYILNNRAYQNWIRSRFTVTTFENEMKWYTTEYTPGHENYATADAMLKFARVNNIMVRGHNVFWDDPNYQPNWVKSFSPSQLNIAVQKRANTIVSRYRGQVISWDVVNENLHFSFFENKLGRDFSTRMFRKVHNIDRQVTLFLNDYNTIEDYRDRMSTPSRYIQKIKEILRYENLPLGIGLEAHFPNSITPNLPYMRSSIDTLASTGFPIWITELDVASQPKQTQWFELILREAHSHPQVRGIVMWTAWSPQGCYRLCLVDNNFRNLPAGNVVDRLINEWGRSTVSGTTDQNGLFKTSLFHGDYEMKISHPNKKNSSFTHKIQVIPANESDKTTKFIQFSF